MRVAKMYSPAGEVWRPTNQPTRSPPPASQLPVLPLKTTPPVSSWTRTFFTISRFRRSKGRSPRYSRRRNATCVVLLPGGNRLGRAVPGEPRRLVLQDARLETGQCVEDLERRAGAQGPSALGLVHAQRAAVASVVQDEERVIARSQVVEAPLEDRRPRIGRREPEPERRARPHRCD